MVPRPRQQLWPWSRSKVKDEVTAWCQLKGLVTRIMHAKYQCSIINTSEDMGQVKFLWRTDRGTDGRMSFTKGAEQKSLYGLIFSKISLPIRGQGGPLAFPISPKNTNLVEGVEILLPVKFRWRLFSSFRREVNNVSADQRPGRPSCFCDRPSKHRLDRGRLDLASCKALLNSVLRFQRGSWKCLSQSEARTAILFFQSTWKTQSW